MSRDTVTLLRSKLDVLSFGSSPQTLIDSVRLRLHHGPAVALTLSMPRFRTTASWPHRTFMLAGLLSSVAALGVCSSTLARASVWVLLVYWLYALAPYALLAVVRDGRRALAVPQPTRRFAGIAVAMSLPLLLGVVVGSIPRVLCSGVFLIPGIQVALLLGGWVCTLASVQEHLVREGKR